MTIAPDTPPQAAGVTAAPSSPPAPASPYGSYDPLLVNEELAPLKQQRWKAYNIFAFWMSDVHSVGGYVTATSLFAMGLASWQVFVAIVIAILFVNLAVNLIAKPSQVTSVPFPVICRAAFGIKGANIPALIRGVIAVAWYGIQTFLASQVLVMLILKLWPSMAEYADESQHSFLGLHPVGYLAFFIMWGLQIVVFWRGMAAIRRFIDVAGPAVYVVMFALAGYLVVKAGGFGALDFSLGSEPLTGGQAVFAFFAAIAIMVSYFSGPSLNFGDISRYGESYAAVKRGNFLGLPVNILFFSALVVVTAAATLPVYGQIITDPVQTIEAIDSTTAVVLGALTVIIATIGINIVANFIAPAFDFSQVAPTRISWRTGGMIAAVGSLLLTPWNLYDSADVIKYTLGILACFIGPLFGVLITFYYYAAKQRVKVDDLYSSAPTGKYWYTGGFNTNAVAATVIGAVVGMCFVLIPAMGHLGDFSWFVSCGVGALAFYLLERSRPQTAPLPTDAELEPSVRVDGGVAHG
ncbi:NCS1 family nucleobase:cation symporter-1 [Dietzia cinnamea]|uniref:NCS1 family nucleobase:cation symporter-1 n=1 Tax=Dietzia cinnamea TaxID=321318 RepID=A0A4R3ZWR9_9ACTN|nr:NCS1 family nucleobase:cation symporter-1 [Dietzia cinnamea]TCW24993.1 NCS1 family nucleobase:cation symporter-1 [Dietzia cinnamea]